MPWGERRHSLLFFGRKWEARESKFEMMAERLLLLLLSLLPLVLLFNMGSEKEGQEAKHSWTKGMKMERESIMEIEDLIDELRVLAI